MATITRLTIIKFLELVVVCVIIGMYLNVYDYGSKETRFLATGTSGGYFIIFIGLFAGALMGTPVNRRIDLFFSILGCVLFIASGALIIDTFRGHIFKTSETNKGYTLGALCIVEGVLLLIDSFFTFRGEA